MIASTIMSVLSGPAAAERVAAVTIGLGYTSVRLAGGGQGVAYTFHRDAGGSCSVFTGLRPLAGRSASELLVLLDSGDPIEAAVGLACANALIGGGPPGAQPGDLLDYVSLLPDDVVAMVGRFGPLVAPISQRVGALSIFERDPTRGVDVRPAGEALAALPRSQVAIITATAILNHTVDELMEAAGRCREVVILGPSTPLLAEAFVDTPVTMLSGIRVVDGTQLSQAIAEGGGTRQFGPYVEKVCLKVQHHEMVQEHGV